MADNIDITPGTGKTVATDDIGGVHIQRVKVGFGDDGDYTDASGLAPLPVGVANEVDVNVINGAPLAVALTAAPDVQFDSTPVTAGTPLPVTATAAATGMPIAGGYLELSGGPVSANGTNVVASADCRVFRSAGLYLTGTFSGTVQVQGTWDGTNWVPLPVQKFTTASPVSIEQPYTNITSFGSSDVFTVALNGCRNIRVRTTSYSSGSVSAVLTLQTDPPSVAQWTGAQSFLPSGDSWSAGGWYALNMAAINHVLGTSTSWERMRTVTLANGTTAGTGVPAAGVMAIDSSGSYRRIVGDTVSGSSSTTLTTTAPSHTTATLTNVSASIASVTVLAAGTGRRGAMFYNDSTASLMLKLGATASATSFTVKIAGGGYYELPAAGVIYRGVIDGIWDAATGAVRVTELT